MFRFKLLKKYFIFFLAVFSGLLASIFYSSDFSLRPEVTLFEKLSEAFYRPLANLAYHACQSANRVYTALATTRQKALLYEDLLPKVKHTSYLESQIKFLQGENTRLKELLQLKQERKEKFLAVRVIGRDPNYIFDSLRIDKGSQEGLRVGQGVLSTQGVVGILFRLWKKSADVLVVTDPNSHLDALVQRNNLRVVLSGHGHEELTFKHSLTHEAVFIGDRLVTSGYSGGFPAGIPIGIVTKVFSYAHGEREIFVEPYSKIDQLSEALVSQDENPYMEVIENSQESSLDQTQSSLRTSW